VKFSSWFLPADLPKELNLGCGNDYREGMLNVDINPELKADKYLDFSDKWLELPREHFSRIIARDVMEHIPNLVQAMRNCLDILQLGGELYVQVPYDLSTGAWQDPTHVRAFNEYSFIYFCEWSWYLGWKDYRFSCEEIILVTTDTGKKLREKGMGDEELMRTPRALECLQVKLKKTRVTEKETQVKVKARVV
jgi:SAM-dependent methyltransferase